MVAGKRKRIFSFLLAFAVGVIICFAGVTGKVQAEENSYDYKWTGLSFLSVGNVEIVKYGVLTGDMPENVSFDPKNNVLTLNNCVVDAALISDSSIQITGINIEYMGDDFTIHLEGTNTIKGTTSDDYYVYSINSSDDLTIEGPGILNLEDTATMGIHYGSDLTIKDCEINISGNKNHQYYFYGMSGNADIETDTYIINSNININNSMSSGSRYANAGIDVQAGNLMISNSEIDIELTNGNIFGLAVGQTDEYGGNLTIDNSAIKCMTDTDLDRGDRNNHYIYFYNMSNADSLYYYVLDDNSFKDKRFDEAFEYNIWTSSPNRYDANSSMIITAAPCPEYCSHEWGKGEVTLEATCTEEGKIIYTCTKCSETKTVAIEATGHDWSEWKVIKEATCTENGARMRTCSRCNITETETIPELGHDAVSEVVTNPTCTEAGLRRERCSRCDAVIKEEIIPATGHDYDWVIEKEASFYEDGVKTGTCSICGNVTTEPIPQLSLTHEHDFSGEEEIIEPATCTKEGSKIIHCTEPECKDYITETISMTEHTPGEWNVVKESTCSENGQEERTCTVCGAVLETRITEKLEHTYGDWQVITPATCTEAGVERTVCTACGETAVRGINPLGHEYGEWNIIKEATVTEEGERQTVCSVCGYVTTESIPKLADTQETTVQETTLQGIESDKAAKPSGNRANQTASENPQTGDTGSVTFYIFAIAISAVIMCRMGKRKWTL